MKWKNEGRLYVPANDSRDHVPSAHCFDNKDIWHDRQNVVMRRERGEPVNGKVVDPHDEDGDVDGEDPEHEDE